MATGNPHKKSKIVTGAFQITYAGKKSDLEILKGKKINFKKTQTKDSEGSLYFGDNKDVLKSLLLDENIRGKVDLVYIDPPFATGSEFISRKLEAAYEDSLLGAKYLEFLRERLILLRDILSEKGSLYLHLDNRMICAAKIILDEIFGEKNFRNLITRKKSNPKNYTSKTFGNVTDFILFYSKTKKYIWNKMSEQIQENHLKEYRYIDDNGRRHMRVPLHAPGSRNGPSGGQWRGMLPPPGKHWQYTPETLERLDRDGHIHWSSNGNPRKKVYLDEHGGVPVQDLWTEFRDAHNQNISITGYPTEKNADLIKRIISASSDQGSLILDCFAGSGTTLDVAGQLKRKWVGIDSSPNAISTIIRRIEKGSEKMGDYVKKNGHVPMLVNGELFPEKVRQITLHWCPDLDKRVKKIALQNRDTKTGKQISAVLKRQ